MIMKKKFPAWLVLTVICVIASALLATTNLMTKDVIAENTKQGKLATLAKLLPDAHSFETLQNPEDSTSGVSIGKDEDGQIMGYVYSAVAKGYGGEVETTVAILPDGTIQGISVGGANFSETAGLGARAKEPEFQAQFTGKKTPVELTKNGGEIDALSGATITSRAVIKGVNDAVQTILEAIGEQTEDSSGITE